MAGRRGADSLVPILLLVLRPLELLLAPLALFTQLVGRFATPFWRPNPRVTEAEVEIMVDHGEQSGVLEEEHAELLRNVLEFEDLCARDAMIPRSRVTAIKVDTPIAAVLRTITETGHSRYPVYREEIDDVFGLIYAKDLFRVVGDSWRPPPVDGEPLARSVSRATRLLDIVRQPIRVVSESQPLSVILKEMRQQREHLAIVVDEFGGFAGIVTLEDILEEIVGDIRDESDALDAPIVETIEGLLDVDASILVQELSAYLGVTLDPNEQHDTLGGLLVDTLGQVPTRGTTVTLEGVRFVVRESDEKHIVRVQIVRPPRLISSEEQPPASSQRRRNALSRMLGS